MPARKLTPRYRKRIEDKLEEFRRISNELRDMLGQLGMLDYMELLAGDKKLGLTPGEIEVLTYGEDDVDDDSK